MDRPLIRRARVAETLGSGQLDALLVSAVSNVHYLTGFTGEYTTLLLTRDRGIVISDGRYATQLSEECPELEVRIRPLGATTARVTAETIKPLGIKRLGIEAAVMTVAECQDLVHQLDGVELVADRGRVESLRAIKDDGEIAAIRRSIAVAERAFQMWAAGLRIGDSEKELADALEGYLRHCGASASSFPPIVAVGKRSALPHARPTTACRAGDADFILVDWGATVGGYKSDLTRVLVTGKVTPEFETVYRTVLAAQERALAAIRPGVLAREVDAEARSVIEEAGFGRFFDHGLGHGIGLDIHEAPALRRESETVLQPGMVVTVEPGIYLPDWGGVRIEDDVLVTADGYDVLTHVPKALNAVGLDRDGT
jgi:Xaa-Pro aminopeptidase